MRLLDALKSASEYLEKAGVEDPFVDAELLVFHAAGTERLAAYVENPVVPKGLASKIKRLLARRARGEPLQYILGHVDFLGLKIHVGKGVLIPRPETELLVEEAMEEIKKKGPGPLHILDLCTGSGCVALALAREFPRAEVYAADVSKTGVRYAKKNAALNGLGNIMFLTGSLFRPVGNDLSFDLITANPPYIKTADIAGLQREIREWEPRAALDGGADGLDFYRNIFSEAAEYLKEKGNIILELGFGQAEEVAALAKDAGFSEITLVKDFAGIERILKAGL